MSDTIQFRVLDFDCPTCASTVEHVEVHYTTGRVEIEYDDSIADTDAFAQTIENQGYTPQPA